MGDVLVTVWCLAYNHEKYIRSALEGFVKQKTNFNYEVIIHDDASTDKTAEIIREYEMKYPDIIKPIYQTENQYRLGKKITRQYLLPNMRGKYVAYCEGDDFWSDENKLQLQFDFMEKNQDVYMCTHKVQCLNEDGTFNERVIPNNIFKNVKFSLNELINLLYKNDSYPFHTSSYFLRREVLESEIYKKFSGTFNGDQILIRTAGLLGNIYYMDQTISCRRLLTIGNWNNRFLKASSEEKTKYYIRIISGEKLFDCLTEYRFHDEITQTIYGILLLSSKMCNKKDTKLIKKFIREDEKYKRLPCKTSLKLKISYTLFQISPKLYKTICNIFK